MDEATGCWNWVGSRHPGGYGRFGLDGRVVYAHRFAVEAFRGPIPDGMQVDHFVCSNPPCCNPAHLRVVTPRENVLRSNAPTAMNAAKTHCLRGHDFAGPRGFWVPRGGGRECRECHRLRERERRARRDRPTGGLDAPA